MVAKKLTLRTGEVVIETPSKRDMVEFLAAMRASVAMHRGLVSPPSTPGAFAKYLERCGRENFAGFLVRRKDGGALVGVVNLSEIVRGGFHSAYMGYYGVSGACGGGLMTAGVALVVSHAFRKMKLHRVEANVQPSNARSIALVKRLGFRMEGYSPRYLKIAGRWRDHERWAVVREEW